MTMTAEQLRAEILKHVEVSKMIAGGLELSGQRVAATHARSSIPFLESIAARLSGMAAVPTWQPIETAPKDGTLIDVWRGEWKERSCNVRYVELASGNAFFETAPGHLGSMCIRDATHWIPLPAAPEPPHG